MSESWFWMQKDLAGVYWWTSRVIRGDYGTAYDKVFNGDESKHGTAFQKMDQDNPISIL